MGDLTKKKNSNDALRKAHEKSIDEEKKLEHLIKSSDKKDNERCFLPNNGKIEYNSIILLELFNNEEFDDLIKGLDELYENSQEELDYYEYFANNKLAFGGWKRLPIISNSNFEDVPIMSMQADLGHHIKFVTVYLHHVLPSMVMLKIHVFFDDVVSDELNEIIYKYHESKIIYHEFPEEIPNQRFFSFTTSTHYPPEGVKTREITDLRLSLKKEVINFFSKYFNGFFFKLSSNDLNIVPSIEIYSLEYPDEEEELIEWGRKCSGFLNCFQTFFSPHDCYKLKYKNISYLFSIEKLTKSFSNHFIFVNGDETDDILDLVSFESVAFSKWLQIQEQKIAKFGSILAEEIDNLQKNRLDDILSNRKIISKSIFYFELFKTEFKLLRPDDNGFKLVGDENIDLNSSWIEGISKRIDNIDEIIYTFNKHFNVVLGLKNVEYSKNMQNRVYILTFIVIGLTIVQIILAFKSEIISWILIYL